MNDNQPSTQPEFVSAERLAALFDPPLSIAFIRDLQTRRTIPFVRLGRRVLFNVNEVQRTLAESLTVRPRKAVAS